MHLDSFSTGLSSFQESVIEKTTSPLTEETEINNRPPQIRIRRTTTGEVSAQDAKLLENTIKCYTGTCQWLLNDERYKAWKNNRHGLLWLRGTPGCGKSVAFTAAIDELTRPHRESSADTEHPPAAYFFFDAQSRKQSTIDLLRSWIIQLSGRFIFNATDNEDISSIAGLLNVLYKFASLQTLPIFLFVDGFERCGDLEELMDLLEVLATEKHGYFCVFANSNVYEGINQRMTKFLQSKSIITMSAASPTSTDQKRSTELHDYPYFKDIIRYVDVRVDRGWTSMVIEDEAMRMEIKKRLVRDSGGMFLWLKYQLDAVDECKDKEAILETISSYPHELDLYYDGLLGALDEVT